MYNNMEEEIPQLHTIGTKDEFELFDIGSRELIDYIMTHTINNECLINKAMVNVPINDINLIAEHIAHSENKELDEQFLKDNYNDIIFQIIITRLSYRVCEHCGNINKPSELKICGDCCLSWYCNKECQKAHWSIHKLRCCNRKGPLDEGYQKIQIITK